jgi:hypothetical protein
MILATDAMIPLMNQAPIIGVTHRKLLTMYDGSMVTKADIEAALYSTVSGSGIMNGTTRGQYRQDLIHNLILAKGGILRGFINYAAALTPQMNGAKRLRFPLSERNEELTKSAVGNVTFFTMAIVGNNVANPTTNTAVYWLGVGTVGVPGSGADMELFGAAIDNTRAVRANDLIFDFSGV